MFYNIFNGKRGEYFYIRTKEENKGRDYSLDKVTPTSHVREAMLTPINMVFFFFIFLLYNIFLFRNERLFFKGLNFSNKCFS